MKYPKKFYSAEQKTWCEKYQAETGFEPLMADYEAGNHTFHEAARFSIDWFESWASDAQLKIGKDVPGWEEALEAEINARGQLRSGCSDGGVREGWNRTTSGDIGQP